VGEKVTIAEFTGAGVVENTWITLGTNSNGTMMWDARLQVYVDGAELPDIDVDLGTLFLLHLDGHLGAARGAATQHVTVGTMGGSGTGMSGGLLMPIPYTNGIVMKLYAPPGSTSHPDSDYTLFTQIMNRPGFNHALGNLRLRSNCVPWLQKKTYAAGDIIEFFDLKNACGTLVWQSVVVQGDGSSENKYDYLERIWFYGVDGEDTTPDANGVVTTAFSNSGGEDLFLYGWYFANAGSISGTKTTLVTATNNVNNTTVAGFDFLAAYGGLKFQNELKPGWSLKPSAVINAGHSMSWCFLYYIDISVPFVPSAPTLSTTVDDGSITLAIVPPVSFGSAPITGYVGTLNPGGVTFSLPATATSTEFTGLENDTLYTIKLSAVSSEGTGLIATTTATPEDTPLPVIPTISSGTVMGQYAAHALALTDGARVGSWPKLSGSKSITFSQATAGNKPLYKEAILNDLAVVRFDPARPDTMTVSGSFNTAAPAWIIAVINPVATADNQFMDSYPGTDGHGRMACGINSGGKWNVYAGALDAEGATGTAAPHVVAFIINGASSYVAVDGVKGSNANIGSGGFDSPILGALNSLNGDVAEFIVGSGAINDSDREAIEDYLTTKYGL
jgi:hypothetical protein